MTETAVRDRLDAEIAAARAEYDTLEARLASIQEAYDRIWKQVMTHLDKGTTPPKALSDKETAYSHQTIDGIGLQSIIRERISRLSSDEEYLRRLQDVSAGGFEQKIKRESAPPKLTARERGVPEIYLGENGNFRPGMDARYKSDLICSALSLPAPDAKMPFDPEDAVKRLDERGWLGFLETKRARVEGGK